MANRISVIITAFAIVAAAFIVGSAITARSSGTAANKMAVAGSAINVSGPGAMTLLTGTLKTSTPEDLIITLSMECSILTNVTTVGNDNAAAFGQILGWVELDGKAIPVGGTDTGAGAGQVTFCERAHERSTSGFNVDTKATISDYQATKTANSFTWITLNVGAGDHTITAKGGLTTTSTNQATAQAVIGKRTLLVDPTKLAQDAVI